MEIKNEFNHTVPIATLLKRCPFCSSRAGVIRTAGQPVFGVRCGGCPVCLPEAFQSCEEAITAWCRRQGTISAAGGRATKGILSWRKGRACRRNLRRARERKRLKWIRTRVDAIASWLKECRAIEIADSEAAFATSMAELAILEPRIRQYPDLSEMLDDLKRRQAQAEDRCPGCESIHQPQPANSVLYVEQNERDQP